MTFLIENDGLAAGVLISLHCKARMTVHTECISNGPLPHQKAIGRVARRRCPPHISPKLTQGTNLRFLNALFDLHKGSFENVLPDLGKGFGSDETNTLLPSS